MIARTNISQRSGSTVTINRVGGSNIEVPITPRSIRRFMLMQDDYIQLEFSLPSAENIRIGDWIQDEVFGRFVVTTEQMPRYNNRTGGYDYSLRFDADYIGWRNWLYCLCIDGKRMESRWDLTDRLDTHVQQVADNVNIITNAVLTPYYDTQTGITTYTSTGYGIEVTADNAAEIKHLAYEGVNIIDAMNAIAQAWSCEWWVKNDSITIGNTTYDRTIHFGKCADTGGAYTINLGTNAESMDIARDQQDFCNRLFVYGGTQNIPEDYDRHLEFTARALISWSYFYDADKTLTLDMIDAEPTVAAVTMPLGAWSQGGTNAERTYTQRTEAVQLSGSHLIDIDLTTQIGISSVDFAPVDLPSVSVAASLHYGDNARIVRIRNYRQGEIIDGIGWFADLSFSSEIDLGSTAVPVYLEIVWSMVITKDTHANDDVTHMTTGRSQAIPTAANKAVTVVFNGNTYNCTFNGANGRISPKPSGMTNGAKYTISNLFLPKVPLSWFSVDYDAGTLATVGEKRLHLPLATYPNRYIDAEGSRTAQQTVERAVVFADVYPRLTLRIKAGTLQGEEKQMRVDHSDGSVSYEDWTQWSFEVEMDKGDGTWGEFDFRDYYILDGEKLQAVFTSPTEAQTTGYMLSGMTFDISVSGVRYTIIRNDDYGALLPNKRLVPTEGDTLVLTGWNPRYITELDMVSAAETALAAKGNEYLSALHEGCYTITAKMMSRTMQFYPFCTGNDQSGRRMFGLLDAGCKVTVNHAALPGGTKTSRVLGYEYKLDMPYDTPSYIIGETEAYSRLKQLEKQIQKL